MKQTLSILKRQSTIAMRAFLSVCLFTDSQGYNPEGWIM